MRKIQFLFVVSVITALCAFALIKNEKTSPNKGYKIGDIATDFKLKNIDDKMVSLADYSEAKGYIIIFTCNTCPVSVAYEDRIIALDKKYKNIGFPVIAINPNDPEVQQGDSFELMKTRAKEKQFTLIIPLPLQGFIQSITKTAINAENERRYALQKQLIFQKKMRKKE